MKLFVVVLISLTVTGCIEKKQEFIPENLDFTQYVNPLQGTNSTREFSTGNTYPAIATPWGLNFWTPQTGRMGDGWQYVYTEDYIRGFKQTHQPSPWINDYGCFSIMPMVGKLEVVENKRKSKFSHSNETVLPHYYQVLLEDYGINVEIAPAHSSASFRFTFPKSENAFIVVDGWNKGSYIKVLPEQQKIIGYSKWYAPNNKAKMPHNFATYFVITFDRPFTQHGVYDGTKKSEGSEIEGNHALGYVKFQTEDNDIITANVSSSFLNSAQAELNLQREIGKNSFDEVCLNAKTEWNNNLRRLEIEGASLEQKRTFYTALYRTLLFPRKLHEWDIDGKMVHYSAMNGEIENGPMYTDNGFWDTFRAVHPFFTIMYPDMSSEIMQALNNYYKEGGWMPEWSSPGYKDCMIGQHSASLVTDAYVKGIRGFDIELAWEAIVKGANNEAEMEAVGRDGVQYYNDLGYIPYNVGKRESVSKTMEYAYNDFCISTLAEALGKPENVVNKYRDRAFNYKNVFDPSINFVRPKDDKGNWESPYRPDTWGGSFTEGSAWHWTWSVFQDPAGLANLMGGKETFIKMLDSVFVASPTFDYSNYNKVIHEMKEMVSCNMGQYAHGNQPIQHAIYLYNYMGQPWKTQKWVRHTMSNLYSSGIEDGKGLCGDEDNGQTSAWFVFSSTGFYPVCPGTNQYIIGAPLFKQTKMKLPNGKTFTVKAPENSETNIYIQSATLNGKVFDKPFITHGEILNGGVMEFVMGPEPNKNWGTSVKPFSLSELN